MEQSTKQIDGLSVDWELANNDAAAWAQQYSGELVTRIGDSTRRRIQREVAAFTQNKETVNQLRNRLMPVFGSDRAQMIAVTEVTRTYAEGNQVAWTESGVTEGKEWNTANDELVCPICGPLDGKVARLDGEFEGGFNGPPAHPRCRCWLTPVVIGDEATSREIFADLPGVGEAADRGRFTTADEIALIERSGFDAFTTIRPPAGRAPRGLGQEYAIRRRLEDRIATQMKYRDIAQEKLSLSRGQTGQRARFRIDVARTRVQELDKGIAAMLDIANDPFAEWAFKSELIDGIIEYIGAVRF